MSDKKVVTEDKKIDSSKSKEQIEKENSKLENELKPKKKAKKKSKVDVNAILEETKKEKDKEEEDMTVMLVDEQDRALNFGVVGVGQAGGRIAEQFYTRGYSTIAINTATQDLKHLGLPESQKLFLDVAIGGTGRDLSLGAQAIEDYSKQILDMMEKHFEDSEVILLTMSGGGGTGSGSAENMAKLAGQLGKPVIMIFAIPLASEDSLAKHNSVQTLARLAKLAQTDVLNSLMIVDNQKIQQVLGPDLSMAKLWEVANNAIVEPLHLFNSLSAMPSKYSSLDPMDFGRVCMGGDCSIYGMIEIKDYLEEDAIAEAILENMTNGLLASEFDLSQTRSAGVIVTGSEKVLSEVSAANLEFGMAMLNKITSEGTQVYRGVYSMDDHPDTLRVYCLLSGLGLPSERVNELKVEAERHMKALEGKEDSRATNMTIDLGKTQSSSVTDQIHQRIKNKKSAMGKLTKNSKRVKDRRRR